MATKQPKTRQRGPVRCASVTNCESRAFASLCLSLLPCQFFHQKQYCNACAYPLQAKSCDADDGATTSSFKNLPDCSQCDEGKFSNGATKADAAVGHGNCKSWRTCVAGQGRAPGTGSAVADLTCAVCPDGKYSGADSTEYCQEHTQCDPGQGLVGESTQTAGTCQASV